MPPCGLDRAPDIRGVGAPRLKESCMTLQSPNRAETWSNLRSLYPLYSAVARESVIEMQPCPELEQAFDAPSAEVVAEAEKWIESRAQGIHDPPFAQFFKTPG